METNRYFKNGNTFTENSTVPLKTIPNKVNIVSVVYESGNPCKNCSNNPQNGGSGICNCTLNLPKITC